VEVIAMKFIGKAFVLGLAIAGTAVAACSTGSHSTAGTATNNGPGGDQANTGRVSAALTLPDGTTITSVTYNISGPTTTSGSVTIGDAQSIEFVVGGLLQGSGYSITLSATDSMGDHCSGSASGFTIVAGAISNVGINMTCPHSTDAVVAADVGTGSLAVDASATIVDAGGAVFCPGITSFSISPAEEPVGSTSALSVSTTIPATITWSVTPGSPAGSGTLDSTTSATPTFTCTGGGNVEVTVTVGVPGSSQCAGLPNTTMTGQIFCEGPSGPPVDSGMDVITMDAPVDTGTCFTALQNACNANLVTNAASLPLPPGHTTCSATEVALWQKDPNTALTGCLNCLLSSGCLNDNLGDSGNECEDPFTGMGASGTAAECVGALNCDVGNVAATCTATSPAPANGAVINAYCGVGVTPTACTATATSPMGACVTPITAGFPASFTPSTIVSNLGIKTYAAGRANAIIACGITNLCTTCNQ
jgi:hypothetical protein